MTATDELRALLDDAGVEWDKGAFPNEARTYWRDVVARPWNEQRLYVTALLTPAQAIAATLGRGTCRDDNVGGDFVCSECQALVQLHSIGRSYVDKFGKRWYATSNEHGLNFCPNCGRRIVEVDG